MNSTDIEKNLIRGDEIIKNIKSGELNVSDITAKAIVSKLKGHQYLYRLNNLFGLKKAIITSLILMGLGFVLLQGVNTKTMDRGRYADTDTRPYREYKRESSTEGLAFALMLFTPFFIGVIFTGLHVNSKKYLILLDEHEHN